MSKWVATILLLLFLGGCELTKTIRGVPVTSAEPLVPLTPPVRTNEQWLVSWSQLKIEPGQMVSAVFKGLDVAPQELRFWLNGQAIETRFDVIRGGGNTSTLTDDLVVAQQFIPLLVPGEYQIALGSADGVRSEPQRLFIAAVEPEQPDSETFETLRQGLQIILEDAGYVASDGNAGFRYYRQGMRGTTITDTRNTINSLSEAILPALADIDRNLPPELASQAKAMLVNLEIVPALANLVGQAPTVSPVTLSSQPNFLIYLDSNSLVLHEMGQRFSLFEWALAHSGTDTDAVLGALRRLDPLWELFRRFKEDLFDFVDNTEREPDGTDPRDTPPPPIYGEEMDPDDDCRVKVQCHWGAATGSLTAWLSKKLMGQRHCAIYTRMTPKNGVSRLGTHIGGNGFTGGILRLNFNSDLGFVETYPDYWDHWDSATARVDECALASCLRSKTNEYEIFKERPYKGFTDGKSITTSVHPNSSSYIGAMVESCRVPTPIPAKGNKSINPLIRNDYSAGYVGWHYWDRAAPPKEFWKTVSSAKTPPVIPPYAPTWYGQMQWKLWWNS